MRKFCWVNSLIVWTQNQGNVGKYFQVPNKRAGENNRELEKVQYNGNQGGWNNQGGWKWFDIIKVRDSNYQGGGGWTN